jgi:enolase
VATLAKLLAREVLDSRGKPTVEVEAIGSDGARGRAIVPSGASTGRHEALELRDGDASRYAGAGVRRAVGHVVDRIAPALRGLPLDDQAAIDAALIALDPTPGRAQLGANAMLGASLAVAHAAAASRHEELFVHLHRLWRDRLGPDEPDAGPVLPLPMVNLISGGLHAGRNLDFQDFLMIPLGARTYPEALEMTAAVHRALGVVLADYGDESALVADEGGYGPKLRANSVAVERILEAVETAGLQPGRDVAIALDVAATHLFDPEGGTYRLRHDGDAVLDAAGMADLMEHWLREFPIASIEDPLAEDDWAGWSALTARIGPRVQLLGDDLFCTQVERVERGRREGAANAVLIKPNQVGTLSETFDALLTARRGGYRAVISARSGETEDATIADLAVATGAGQIKIGCITRSERLAKYNRLLRIAESLGPAAPFAGAAALR